MNKRSKKPSRMKPLVGWMLVYREYNLPYDLYVDDKLWMARQRLSRNPDFRLAKVEIRELVKPKKEKKAR